MSDMFWWAQEPELAFEDIFGHVRSVEENQRNIVELNIRHARLYSNTDVFGIDWTVDRRSFSSNNASTARVSENVIMSVIDTATAMVAKNRPRPTYLTENAVFSTQRRARMLDLAVQGMFQHANVYQKAQMMFRDACVFGTGFLYPFEEDGKVQVEKILPDEIIADNRECRATLRPRQLHRRKFVDREVLKAMFPEASTEIENANTTEQGRRWTSFRKTDVDQVVVVESWHLPSIKGAGDGVHAISIENKTLLWEEYEDNDYPFVAFRWSPRLTGYYGQGLAEQITGIQLRINKLNKFIDRAQDLIAVPRIFVDVASKNLKLHLNNEIGAIIPYRGKTPTFLTPQAVGNEIYSYKEVLKQSAFEFAGISRLSAQAQKPAGLESAVALRTFNDIETSRFAIQAQNLEQAIALDLANKMVKVAKRIFGSGQKFESIFAAKDFIKKIDWSEVDMEEDRFVMKVQASSILGNTPAGRTQTVIEWAQAGLINQDEAKELMDLPDLNKQKSMFNAAIENIDATIERMLDGEYFPPEPFQNLELGINRVQQSYLRARLDGAPEEILELLRQWMEQAQQLLSPPPEPEQLGAEALAPQIGGALPPDIPSASVPLPPQAAFADQAQELQPS